jgi:hypothetical protein
VNARVVQRESLDEEGNLMSPGELYLKLTERTLFTATISLEAFIIKEKQNPARYHERKVSILRKWFQCS